MAFQPKANDPLAGLTQKQIFLECVWESEETTATKLFLLCVARYFDKDARSSSMSYTQIARDCGLTKSYSTKIATKVLGRWLEIKKGKGFNVPGKGAQNLYHGICPPDVVESIRSRRAGGRAAMHQEGEVNSVHPEIRSGVYSDHQRGELSSPVHEIYIDKQTDVLGSLIDPLIDLTRRVLKSPATREQAGDVLRAVTLPLQQYDPDVASAAVADAIADVGMMAEEGTFKGTTLVGLKNYLTLRARTKADNEDLARATREANGRAEQFLHEQRLSRRLNASSEGPRNKRRSGSFADLAHLAVRVLDEEDSA